MNKSFSLGLLLEVCFYQNVGLGLGVNCQYSYPSRPVQAPLMGWVHLWPKGPGPAASEVGGPSPILAMCKGM